MDIRQLQYFVTIIEEGQITLAAKKLNMAQPPLSQQLKNLEEELNTKLILRHGRKMEMTEAGEILYKKGKELLHNLKGIEMEVKETGGGLRGTLNIATTTSSLCFLPERIKSFKSVFPNVTFNIREGDPYLITDYLKNRNIELAIVRSPTDTASYSSKHLGQEPFVFITPKSWGINPQSKITMKEISEYPLLLLHRIYGTGAYELILSEFKKHGLTPKIECESPDAIILLSLVEAGIGATILPMSAAFVFSNRGLNFVEISDCTIKMDAFLIWLKDSYLTKVAQKFIESFNA
jgi:DNA-binding transcriptional LysR family regulator